MNARVTYVQAPPEKLDEGLELWHERVLPLTRQQAGWRGVVSLVDRATGKSLAITFWGTEADLLESERVSYLEKTGGRIAGFFSGTKPPENYEVDLAEIRE